MSRLDPGKETEIRHWTESGFDTHVSNVRLLLAELDVLRDEALAMRARVISADACWDGADRRATEADAKTARLWMALAKAREMVADIGFGGKYCPRDVVDFIDATLKAEPK